MVGTGPALYRVEPGAEGGRDAHRHSSTGGHASRATSSCASRAPATCSPPGHPQEGALPENLALIRSTDHGETWQAVAGHREADYHELESPGS